MINICLMGALDDLPQPEEGIYIDVRTPLQAWLACEAMIPGFRAATLAHRHTLSMTVDGEPVTPDHINWPLPTDADEITIYPEATGEIGDAIYAVYAAVFLSAFALTTSLRSTNTVGQRNSAALFDGPVVTAEEGGALPIVYGGPIRIGPIVASAGITWKRIAGGHWQQVARITDLLCEGQIGGLVDGNRSVLVNGASIGAQDAIREIAVQRDPAATQGFRWQTAREVFVKYGAEVVLRDGGSANTSVDVAHTATETERSVSEEITLGGTTGARRVENRLAKRLRLAILINQLFRTDSRGNRKRQAISGVVEAKEPTESEWRTIYTFTDYEQFALNRIEFFIEVNIAQFSIPEIRYRDTTSYTAGQDDPITFNLSWARLTEIVDIKQTFPYTAYAYLEIPVSIEQAVADRAYEIYGIRCLIPSNYDPVTRAYADPDDWEGNLRRLTSAGSVPQTDNPAWIAYDLLSNARYGLGRHLPQDQVFASRFAWYKIARFCDELVPDGRGGMEPRYRMSIALTDRENAVDWVKRILAAFDCELYESGGALLPVQLRDAEPVAIVAPINVKDGKISRSSDRRDRFSVVTVRWNDPDQSGKQATEIVVDESLVKEIGFKQTSITADGCFHRGQAHRYGRHYLLRQEHEHEVVKYTAGVDHAGLRAGDIVLANLSDKPVRLYGRLKELPTNRGSPETGFTTFWFRDNKGLILIRESVIGVRGILSVHWITPKGKYFCCNQVQLIAQSNNRITALHVRPQVAAEDMPQIDTPILLESPLAKPEKVRITEIEEVSQTEFKVTARIHFADRYRLAEAAPNLNEPTWRTRPPELVAPTATLDDDLLFNDNGCERILQLSITPAANSEASGYELQVADAGGGEGWQPWLTGTQELVHVVPGTVIGVPRRVRVRAIAGIRASDWVIAEDTPSTIERQTIYARSGVTNQRPPDPVTTANGFRNDDFTPTGWSRSVVFPQADGQTVWQSHRYGESDTDGTNGRWCEWLQPEVLRIYNARDGADGLPGADGADGRDGEDGAGVEYIYARTDSPDPIPENQRPLNEWGFDQPGDVRGLQWYDYAPDLTEDERYLWRCQRPLNGSPLVGDAVAAPWSEPTNIASTGRDGLWANHSGDIQWFVNGNRRIPEAREIRATFAFYRGGEEIPPESGRLRRLNVVYRSSGIDIMYWPAEGAVYAPQSITVDGMRFTSVGNSTDAVAVTVTHLATGLSVTIRAFAIDTSGPSTESLQTIYRARSSAPSRPVSAPDAIPQDWSPTPGSATNQVAIYRSTRTLTTSSTGVPESATPWTDPVIHEARLPVLSERTVNIYTTATDTPSRPVGDNPQGWNPTRPPPTATDGVYCSSRVEYLEDGTVDTVSAWSEPAQIDAPRPVITSRLERVYQLSASRPDMPTANEYPPPGWQPTEPTPTSSHASWVTTRTVTLSNGAVSSRSDWSEPEQSAMAATSSETRYILASASPPQPSGDSPAGWTPVQPSPVAGRGVWSSTRTLTTIGDVTTAGDWSSPVQVVPPLPELASLDARITTTINYVDEHFTSWTLSANPAGGSQPYSYRWSTGSILRSITTTVGAPGREYVLTVTDSTGAVDSASAFIRHNEPA